MSKIGIYSGTFDPIHRGHVAFAKEAIKTCDLEKVVFLPEAKPRGKEKVSPLSIRSEHIANTLATHPQLETITLSSERFTYATAMPELRRLYPNAEFTLLMGSDVAKGLVYGWEDAEKLFAECGIIVGLRNNDTAMNIDSVLSSFTDHYSISISYCITRHRFENSSALRQQYI